MPTSQHARPVEAAARDHALALLSASPVYARVARILGADAARGDHPLMAGRSDIGARLTQLPAGWHVVPADGVQPVEHLVIGPAGVFAVAVLHHVDAAVHVEGELIAVNGRHQRGLAELRRATSRLAKSLSAAAGEAVTVRPVLAVSGAQRGYAVKRQPREVTVVNRQTITAFLHAQPAVLDAAAVDRLVTAAGRIAAAR
jgi:hypothetical protein